MCEKHREKNSLSEADLQVGGEIFAWGEGVLPDHHVGDVIDGETQLRQRRVQLVQAGNTKEGVSDSRLHYKLISVRLRSPTGH